MENLPDGPYPPADANHPIFQNLRNLIIRGGDFEPLIQFLRRCSPLPLYSLKLFVRDVSSAAKMTQLYTAVTESCSHVSLHDLSFEHQGGQVHPHAIDDSLLPLLFCFADLRTVSIRSAGEFDMCDSTLAQAARAWPHLTTLTLHIDRPSQTWPSPLRLTLASLHSLALHCPHLQSLTLTLDATILPPLIRTPSPSISWLTHLCIAQSPISNLGAVTRFLSDIFPHVRTINHPFLYPALVGPTRSDALRVWKQVQDLLPDFLATRKEERSRAFMQ